MISLAKKKILIIEDEIVIQAYYKSVFSSFKDYEIYNATTAEEGLSLAKTMHFDLVLSDINLPHISGLTFCKLFRKYDDKDWEVPVIAITSDKEQRNNCLKYGFNDFITKPVSKADLKNITNYWLSREQRLATEYL